MTSIDVTDWEPAREEQLGSKPKQWLRRGPELWLWKESTVHHDARHGAFRKGDDWSEVVAGIVGAGLGVPVAEVQLATRGDRYGVISRSVLSGPGESLDLGNELLAEVGIRLGGGSRRSGYTVEAIEQALRDVDPPETSSILPRAFAWFAGYLVFDALVGNTDRHQDNWGAIKAPDRKRLAPSFDHASCLAFQISEAERIERLSGQTGRTVDAYAAKAQSKFDGRPPLVAVAVEALLLAGGTARAHWEQRLHECDLRFVSNGISDERMSPTAKHLSSRLLEVNRSLLSQAIRTMGS